MSAKAKVQEVMFYTKSDDAHNRQMVATLEDGKVLRFSEGKMREELLGNIMPESLLREIEEVAYSKAITFRQVEEDWTKVQHLLCEFQLELDAIFD